MLKVLWKWTLFTVILYNVAVAEKVRPSEEDTTSSVTHANNEKVMTELQKMRDDLRSIQEANEACNKALEDSLSDNDLKSRDFEQQISEQEKEHVKLRQQLDMAKNQISQCEVDYDNQKQTVSEAEDNVKVLNGKVEKLGKQLVVKQEKINQCGTKLSESQKRLKIEENMIRRLERDIKMSLKRNEALKYELDHQSDKLTLAALLSAYYDQGMDAAEWLAKKIQVWVQSDDNFMSAFSQHLRTMQLSIAKSSRAFYANHLAATMDPIASKIYRFVQPHYKNLAPRVQTFSAKARLEVEETLVRAFEEFKLFRVRTIKSLLQHKHIAPHARLIVDGALALLLIPSTIFFLRFLLRCMWWCLCSLGNLCLCCVCCGRCGKRRHRSKRKQLRTIKRAAQNNSARRHVAKKNN
ncbi:hypothetical protein ABG067_000373 [Albugo candida]